MLEIQESLSLEIHLWKNINIEQRIIIVNCWNKSFFILTLLRCEWLHALTEETV
jgi:hypothetical protein